MFTLTFVDLENETMVARFSSGDSDVKDKPRSGRPCTAVTPRNDERLGQLVHASMKDRMAWNVVLCNSLSVFTFYK